MSKYTDKDRERKRIRPEWPHHFEDFYVQAEKRMRKGHREYGDRSYSRTLVSLLREIEEELLDAPNWCSVAWHNFHQLKAKILILQDWLDEAELKKRLDEQAEP